MRFKKVIATLGMASAITLGATGLSATPAAPSTPKAEASSLNSCYVDMFGRSACYRTGCTTLEIFFNGCYTGWITVNKPWYA